MTLSLSHLSGLKLMGAPVKLTVSQGQPVKLNCSVEGMEEPEIQWVKDGAVVHSMDQVYIPVSEQHWIGFLRCRTGGGCGMPVWGHVVFFHGIWELGATLMLRGLWFFVFFLIWPPVDTSRNGGRLNPLSLPSRAAPLDSGRPGVLFPQPEVSGAL